MERYFLHSLLKLCNENLQIAKFYDQLFDNAYQLGMPQSYAKHHFLALVQRYFAAFLGNPCTENQTLSSKTRILSILYVKILKYNVLEVNYIKACIIN